MPTGRISNLHMTWQLAATAALRRPGLTESTMDATERTAAIRAQRQPADRPPEQLWVADAWRSFDVWRVPLDLLVLNVENRRFAAERKYFEAKLGGLTLDPENRELDALSLESILLDSGRRVENGRVVGKPSKDTVALEADWLNRGPGAALLDST